VQYDMSNATGSPKQLYNFNSGYSNKKSGLCLTPGQAMMWNVLDIKQAC